jgi:hypothetical protein
MALSDTARLSLWLNVARWVTWLTLSIGLVTLAGLVS